MSGTDRGRRHLVRGCCQAPPSLQPLERLPCTAQESGSYTPGTRLWVSGKWPGVAWSLSLCNKGVAAALVLSRPAATTTVLVRYYGEHTTAWVTAGRCQPFASCEDEERAQHAALAAWCQKTGRRVSSWTWLGAMHLS